MSRKVLAIHRASRALLGLGAALALALPAAVSAGPPPKEKSVARLWNEEMLQGIRRDVARPTVHARNLFHVSAAMWDAWAAYDPNAAGFASFEKAVPDPEDTPEDVKAKREITISYAAYNVLMARYSHTPGAATTVPELIDLMAQLGNDPFFTSTNGLNPRALGNRIAIRVLSMGLSEGANEADNYKTTNGYEPINPPLAPFLDYDKNDPLVDVNRWQPLALDAFVDQGGIVLGAYPAFITPHWGDLRPFALTENDKNPMNGVYVDPGPPALLGGVGDQEYKDAFLEVAELSGWLDPDDGVMIDIGPGAYGNNPLGTNDGTGHALNPATGMPYAANVVKRGDFARCLAEFWADGPTSETPPGHWNTIANDVTDYPGFERRLGGVGPELDPLEWDVKMYLALNGALHDVAMAVWQIKWHYDFIRPISAIRYMCSMGQSSDDQLPSYHPHGIPLKPGVSELITAETIMPGGRHEHLVERAGDFIIDDHVGDIALYCWNGHVEFPETQYSGAGWNLGVKWTPYQRPTFVTPPFAGYVSGHSTFSRAGAEVLAALTGSEFFPGGLGTYTFQQNQYLVFEDGPSETITLTWGTYFDASDQSSRSRIFGSIHPRIDDFPGRLIGHELGPKAYQRALQHFSGTLDPRSAWRVY